MLRFSGIAFHVRIILLATVACFVTEPTNSSLANKKQLVFWNTLDLTQQATTLRLGEGLVGHWKLDGNTRVTSLTKREYQYDDVRIGGHWNDAYRFNGGIDDSQGMLFIDGSSEPALVGKVGSPNQSRHSKPNEVAFGDCTTNALSDVHVKGFWYANNARAKSQYHPEPKPQTALIHDARRGTCQPRKASGKAVHSGSPSAK
jgi:hypothetical protein